MGGFPEINEQNLAEKFHEFYEEFSKEVGWETQESTKVPFVSLPEKNVVVMLRTCRRIIEEFALKMNEDAFVFLLDVQAFFVAMSTGDMDKDGFIRKIQELIINYRRRWGIDKSGE